MPEPISFACDEGHDDGNGGSQSAELGSELRYLQSENAKLTERIDSLGTAEAIEQIAREEHGYVRPFEENYVVVVPPGVVARVPSVWPF